MRGEGLFLVELKIHKKKHKASNILCFMLFFCKITHRPKNNPSPLIPSSPVYKIRIQFYTGL